MSCLRFRWHQSVFKNDKMIRLNYLTILLTDISSTKKCPFCAQDNKFWRYLKGLWHASAHVRHLDFCSGERFFKISFWWRNPLPSTLRSPRKPWYQYSRAIWRHILYSCASIVDKFEVIEEKCTKPCSLLSVFLQTDQVWRVMWSSGFHFCLLSYPVNDLPFPDSS